MSKMQRYEAACEQYELIRCDLSTLKHRGASGDYSPEYRQRCRNIVPRIENRLSRWEKHINEIAPAKYKR